MVALANTRTSKIRQPTSGHIGQKRVPSPETRLATRNGALDRETIAQVSKRGRLIDYDSGDCIHLRGDGDARLSVIVSGSVNLSNTDANGKRVELVRLSDGDMFGVHQTLSGTPYTHDICAIRPTRIVSFDRATLETLIDSQKNFRNGLLIYLSDRLVRAMRIIENERRHPLYIRLAKHLYANRNPTTGIVSGSQASHAESLGVSRNALGACLQQMASLGLLSIGRQAIHIPSAERLSHWVENETAAE